MGSRIATFSSNYMLRSYMTKVGCSPVVKLYWLLPYEDHARLGGFPKLGVPVWGSLR